MAGCMLVLLLSLAAPAGVGAVPAPGPDPGPWIVELEPGADAPSVAARARGRLGVRAGHVFRHAFPGFAARLGAAQRIALLRDPAVRSITPDHRITATFEPQRVQPGIERIDAPDNPDRAGQPLDVDLAIIDTGIQPDHPDLNVAGGYNCTAPGQSESARRQPSAWRDGGMGHGTHVAGIAAARDNGRGVVGVAPGARLWSVKVLDHAGLGYWSWVICGIDWVASQADPGDPGRPLVEVANMSLAGGGTDDGDCGLTNFDPLHRAICRLERAGVTVVAAAGNEADDTGGWVPAAYDEVIAVSAMADYDGRPGGLGSKPVAGCPGGDDAFAPFSNHGADVDLIAPGVCILSTLPGGAYGRLSGTSMAAPHAAGGAALFHLWEERHGRSRPRPPAVRAALLATGTLDWRTSTDPDRGAAGGVREPLLNVASFTLAPTFRMGVTPSTARRGPAEAANFDVWIARLAGFDGRPMFAVAGLPAGATWTEQPDPMGVEGSGWRRIRVQLPASGPAASYDIAISATIGGVRRSAGVRLHFLGSATPASTGPRLELRDGAQSPLVPVPARVAWKAVAGASRYELQASRNGGPWTGVALPSPTSTHVNRNAWPGSTYQHRVRAMTAAGWGPWVLGEVSVAVPRYAPFDGVDLAGEWSRSSSVSSYSELPVYSRQAGATARLAFTGRSVSWIATRGTNRGKARVYVDGTPVETVDLYASRTQYRRVVFSASWPDAGEHTIEIRVLGTSGRPRVDVDAIVVVRDVAYEP